MWTDGAMYRTGIWRNSPIVLARSTEGNLDDINRNIGQIFKRPALVDPRPPPAITDFLATSIFRKLFGAIAT